MNADGSNPHAITTQGDNTEPNWSPDRRTIIYTANKDTGGSQLHVINADGSSDHAVTKDGGYASSWSPDGQHIAFISDRQGGAQLFVMNSDGSNPAKLTNDPNSEATETTWSPDGRITFVYNKSGFGAVWLINTDGSNGQQLTHDANGNVAGPSWSPDGKHLAYVLTIDGDSDILTSDPTGANGTQIASLSGKYADNVTWSPDNRQLAFMVWENKKTKAIFVVNANPNGTLRQLSAEVDDAGWPSWGSLPPTAPSSTGNGGSTTGTVLCPNSPPPRLAIGMTARVVSDPPLSNRLRATPAGASILLMPPGTTMSVIGGPQCAIIGGSNYTWWQVQAGTHKGWTVEGDGSTYWLEPA
jgi:Tol biopolymer transport system component